MQNLFQFLMYKIFGKHWLLYDLKHGYKATLFINELELDMHKEKLASVEKTKVKMEEDFAELQARPELEDADIIAMLPEEEKESQKALYDLKKKLNGERAEEVTALRNRITQMDDEVATASGELQKGFAMTYQNRVKYDFIKGYKIKKTYADR